MPSTAGFSEIFNLANEGGSVAAAKTSSGAGGGGKSWLDAPSWNIDIPILVIVALVVVGVLILVAFVSKWGGQRHKAYPPNVIKSCKRLVGQAARWGNAAVQDTVPLLKLVHVNYGMAYVRAARTLADDEELQRITQVDVRELYLLLETQQQDIIKEIIKQCPNLQPEGVYAVSTGWID